MSALNPHQFEQGTLPGFDAASTVQADGAIKGARIRAKHQAPISVNLLHYTNDPDFKVDQQRRPADLEDQGLKHGRGISLFGTNNPAAWRNLDWINDRPYVARVKATGTWGRDITPSKVDLPETHVFDTAKVEVQGVHRAHIFRSQNEGLGYTGVGEQGGPFAVDDEEEYGGVPYGRQLSGPKVSPMRPRQPKLPGTNEPHLRPSKEGLRSLRRTNLFRD